MQAVLPETNASELQQAVGRQVAGVRLHLGLARQPCALLSACLLLHATTCMGVICCSDDGLRHAGGRQRTVPLTTRVLLAACLDLGLQQLRDAMMSQAKNLSHAQLL